MKEKISNLWINLKSSPILIFFVILFIGLAIVGVVYILSISNNREPGKASPTDSPVNITVTQNPIEPSDNAFQNFLHEKGVEGHQLFATFSPSLSDNQFYAYVMDMNTKQTIVSKKFSINKGDININNSFSKPFDFNPQNGDVLIESRISHVTKEQIEQNDQDACVSGEYSVPNCEQIIFKGNMLSDEINVFYTENFSFEWDLDTKNNQLLVRQITGDTSKDALEVFTTVDFDTKEDKSLFSQKFLRFTTDEVMPNFHGLSHINDGNYYNLRYATDNQFFVQKIDLSNGVASSDKIPQNLITDFSNNRCSSFEDVKFTEEGIVAASHSWKWMNNEYFLCVMNLSTGSLYTIPIMDNGMSDLRIGNNNIFFINTHISLKNLVVADMNTRAWEYSDFYGMPVSISPDGNYIVIDKLTNTYSYSAADLSVIDLKSSSEIDISSLFHKEESEDEHTIFYNWRQIPMRWFIIK